MHRGLKSSAHFALAIAVLGELFAAAPSVAQPPGWLPAFCQRLLAAPVRRGRQVGTSMRAANLATSKAVIAQPQPDLLQPPQSEMWERWKYGLGLYLKSLPEFQFIAQTQNFTTQIRSEGIDDPLYVSAHLEDSAPKALDVTQWPLYFYVSEAAFQQTKLAVYGLPRSVQSFRNMGSWGGDYVVLFESYADGHGPLKVRQIETLRQDWEGDPYQQKYKFTYTRQPIPGTDRMLNRITLTENGVALLPFGYVELLRRLTRLVGPFPKKLAKVEAKNAGARPEVFNPARLEVMPAWDHYQLQGADMFLGARIYLLNYFRQASMILAIDDASRLIPSQPTGIRLRQITEMANGSSDADMAMIDDPFESWDFLKVPSKVITLRARWKPAIQDLRVSGVALGDAFYALRLNAWTEDDRVLSKQESNVYVPRYRPMDESRLPQWLRAQAAGRPRLPVGFASGGRVSLHRIGYYRKHSPTKYYLPYGEDASWKELYLDPGFSGVWQFDGDFIVLTLFPN